MFTRFMISKAFRGFSRRAIRIFSRSVIGVPCVGICDGTRCADRLQRVRSLVIFRSRAVRLRGPLWPRKRTSSAWLPRVRFVPTGDIARSQTETLKAKQPRTMPGRCCCSPSTTTMRQCICPNSTDGRSRGFELCNICSEVALWGRWQELSDVSAVLVGWCAMLRRAKGGRVAAISLWCSIC